MLQSQEMWLPDADTTLGDFNKIREWFGPNQYLTIGVNAPSETHPVYNPVTLNVVNEITEYLDGHELVVKVSSLSNHEYMVSGTGTLWLKDIVTEDDYQTSGPELIKNMTEQVQAALLSKPSALNETESFARISALITFRQDDVLHHVQIVQDLEAYIKEQGYEEQGVIFEFSGFPYIAAKTTLNNMKDQSTLLPTLLILLLVMLRLVLGRWAYTWMPLVLATMTTIITLGFMGAMGFPLTMVNASLPLIIIAISVVDSVHLISHFNHHLSHSNNPTQSALETAKSLWRPCLFTTLTTVIGFISLSVSEMLPVSEYGYAAAFSIVIAYILSMTFIIAWLSFIKKPSSNRMSIEWLPRIINYWATFAMKNSRVVLASTAVIVLAFAGLASNLTADANYLRFFKQNSSVASGIHFFDDEFGGANSLEFGLDSGSENGVFEPSFLKRADAFQNRINLLSNAGPAQSLLQHLKNLNNVFVGTMDLPSSANQTAQYLFLYASNNPIEDLTDLRSFDGRYFRVTLPVKHRDASDMKLLLSEVDDLIENEFSDLNITVSGDLYLQHQTEYYIQANLIESFSIALAAIAICLLIVFRSIRIGVLALIPSLTPLIIAAGLMYVFGVYLDFGTMIVASITIGIAVDDTIHVINDYQQAKSAGKSAEEAMFISMNHAGLAVFATSIILMIAFVVMSFSSFMPNVYFGIFSAVIILGALVANIICLPALIKVLESKPRSLKTVEAVEGN